jgi:hypothetical protein
MENFAQLFLVVGTVAWIACGIASLHSRKASLWIGCTAACCYVVYGAATTHVMWSNEDASSQQNQPSQTSGFLTPGNKPMPPLRHKEPPPHFIIGPDDATEEAMKLCEAEPTFEKAPASATRIYFGQIFVWTVKFPYAIVAQDEEDLMVIDRNERGEIAISAKFFNAGGKILCEIDKNRFQRHATNTWSMKTDAHRLVVNDDEARPIIDVEFLNPRAIRISGEFYLRDGFIVSIKQDKQIFGLLHFEDEIAMTAVGPGNPTAFLIGGPKDNARPSVFQIPVDWKSRPTVTIGSYSDNQPATDHPD